MSATLSTSSRISAYERSAMMESGESHIEEAERPHTELHLTAYSVRSCLALAFGGGSPLA
jgi:hypothetical protein